ARHDLHDVLVREDARHDLRDVHNLRDVHVLDVERRLRVTSTSATRPDTASSTSTSSTTLPSRLLEHDLRDVHNLDEVAAIAEKIRSHAAEPIQLSGTTIHTTVSIGATLAAPGESDSETTKRADEAMYRAKRAGRNTVSRI
ncbi:MAG: diguanylate cyclase domain-containing protein, partial [Mycobacterium sp.]